jgi:predicted nucleotidyltransferase component of viral defense system
MLGWLLAGISHHKELKTSWIFKGGTCLKKCYFETYRFSEDLDFTLTLLQHQNEAFLIDIFKEIAVWIYDNAGIEIPSEKIRFEIIKSKIGRINVEGRIYYKGPLGFRGAHPRIKLDLTAAELVALDPIDRPVHHPYSDSPEAGIQIRSYCFEEIFAEKLRALGERLRPRDLYDVIHLYRQRNKTQDRELIFNTLKKKCEFKEIPVPSLKMLENKPERAELESEWENMLGHQVPALPLFSQYWEELPKVFEWLFHAVEETAPAAIPDLGQKVDKAWHPPAYAQAWRTNTPIEIIRYAASSRLCINLTYNGSNRLIEPYSLRRAQDGSVLLYAVKHDTGENRSYRVDRIQNAKVTQIAFRPKYAIELSEPGLLAVLPRVSKRISAERSYPISTTIERSRGPEYIFQCSLCGKRFTRKSNNPNLNKHKNKQGFPCPSRIGIYITTKY